jgi:regulator of protease activity HflC (stomatin/prohibitin superfamily)
MVIVFMIRDPVDFVYKLGAVHFDQLLSGAVDESIRILVRSHNHDNVYTLRGNRAVEVLTHLNQKFDSCGVVFSNCTIKSVELPESLMACHENATSMEKAMQKSKRQQEFEIGEIKRRSEIELEELRWKSQQALVLENGKKKRAELEHEQKLVKASEHLQNATIETQQKIQVRLMEARALLERTKTEMEKTKVEMISKAQVEAEATKVQADIGYETILLNAEAERQKLSGEAKAIKMDADAEREASRHLTHKRKHEIEMREKEILTKLAQKANYNMIGESGDKIVGAMLTGHLSTGPSQGGVGSWFK